MNNKFAKIAAAVSAVILCAAPTISASAKTDYNKDHFKTYGRCGDVNNDGRVDSLDGSWTLAYVDNHAPAGFRKDMADVNSDGKITRADAYLMAEYYSKVSTNKVADGDVDGDGEVQLNDAIAILQYFANPEKYPIANKITADVTKDGRITKVDAYLIQKYDAHLISNFDILLGDVDHNGQVDPSDVRIIQNYWQTGTQPSKSDFLMFDAYPDGIFDGSDYNSIFTRVYLGFYY